MKVAKTSFGQVPLPFRGSHNFQAKFRSEQLRIQRLSNSSGLKSGMGTLLAGYGFFAFAVQTDLIKQAVLSRPLDSRNKDS